jgi:hypothetical protein
MYNKKFNKITLKQNLIISGNTIDNKQILIIPRNILEEFYKEAQIKKISVTTD